MSEGYRESMNCRSDDGKFLLKVDRYEPSGIVTVTVSVMPLSNVVCTFNMPSRSAQLIGGVMVGKAPENGGPHGRRP